MANPLLLQGIGGGAQLVGGLLSGIGARKRAKSAERAFNQYMSGQLSEAARLRGEASLQREAIDDPRFNAGQREQVERARARSSEAIGSQRTLGAAERAVLQGQADIATGDQLNQIEAQQRQRFIQGLQVEQQGRQVAGQITGQVLSDKASRDQRQADLAKQFQSSLTGAGISTLTNFGQNLLQSQQNERYLDILAKNNDDGLVDYTGAPSVAAPSATDKQMRQLTRKIRRSPGLLDDPRPVDRFKEGGAGVVPGDGAGDKVPTVLEPGEVVFSNADLEYINSAGTDEERGVRYAEVYKKYEREAQMEGKREAATGGAGEQITEIVQLATQLGMPPDEQDVARLESLEAQDLEALAAGLRAQVAEANGATPRAMREGGMTGGGDPAEEARKRETARRQAEEEALNRSIQTEDGRTLVVRDILLKDPKLRDSDENVFLITLDQELRGGSSPGPQGLLSGISNLLGITSAPQPSYGLSVASLQQSVLQQAQQRQASRSEDLNEDLLATRRYVDEVRARGVGIDNKNLQEAEARLDMLARAKSNPQLAEQLATEKTRQRLLNSPMFQGLGMPKGPSTEAASDATRTSTPPVGAQNRFISQARTLFESAKPGTRTYEALEVISDAKPRAMSAAERMARDERRNSLLQRVSEIGLEDTLKEIEAGKTLDGTPALLRGLLN